jgi:hypothetical protein
MDVNEFWSLIGHSYKSAKGDLNVQVELLVEKLVNGPTEEILVYDSIFQRLLDDANIAALWDAADIIGCGCGYDDFRDFRGWLIAHGKEIYENAISNPESLVDVVEVNERARHEEFLYVSIYAYERKTGSPYFHRKKMINIDVRGTRSPEKEKLFPKLAAKFGDCEKRQTLFE